MLQTAYLRYDDLYVVLIDADPPSVAVRFALIDHPQRGRCTVLLSDLELSR